MALSKNDHLLDGIYTTLHSIFLNDRLSKQIALTFGVSAFLQVLGLLTGIMVARLLGPLGRGELAAIQLWGSFIATLGTGGISEGMVYFVAQSPTKARQYCISGIYLALIGGSPVIILGVFGLSWLLQAQSPEVISIARVYTAGLFVLYTVSWMPLSALRGLKRFTEWNLLRSLANIGWLFVLVIGFVLGEATPRVLAFGFLVSTAVSAFVVVVLGLREIPGLHALDLALWPAMIKYGLPITASSIPTYLIESGRLSQMFIAAILPPEAVGLFAVAVAWSESTAIIPQVIGQVVFPRLAAARGVCQQAIEMVRGARLVTLPLFGLCSLLVILCPIAVPFLFGSEFNAAVPSAMVMVIAAGMAGLKTILRQEFYGLGKPGVSLAGEVVGITLIILSLLFLMNPLGIIGVAMATLIGNSGSSVLLLWLAKQYTRKSIFEFLVPSWDEFRTLVVLFRKN